MIQGGDRDTKMIPCTHYKGKPLLIKLLLMFFVPNPVPTVTRIVR